MAEFVDDLQAMLDAADAMLSEGDSEQAFVLLDRLVVTYPDSPDVALMLGDAEFDYGNPEAALEEYDRAVEQDPAWSEAYSARANCLVELGRLDEAENDVDQALRIDPRTAQAHYVRAVIKELKGSEGEADQGYKTATSLAPKAFRIPVRVTRRSFDRAVRSAIKLLPQRFKDRMDGVDIYVKDLPEPQDHPDANLSPLIMGAFDGYSLTERMETNPWTQVPPRIYLYQKNIERVCASREDLVREIRVTLLHEVGHFFGLGEEDLERINLK